jgi:hypothetical protein
MNRSIIALLTACLMLSIHFSLCLWSAITQSSSPQASVHQYTHPLFVQPWHTIGCDFPTNVMDLEYRVCNESQWAEWSDASDSLSSGESTPAGRLEQSILDDLRWQVTHNLYSTNGRPRFDRIQQSGAYARAIYYVARMKQMRESFSPDSLQLRLAIGFIPPTDQAYSEQTSYLQFPALSIP